MSEPFSYTEPQWAEIVEAIEPHTRHNPHWTNDDPSTRALLPTRWSIRLQLEQAGRDYLFQAGFQAMQSVIRKDGARIVTKSDAFLATIEGALRTIKGAGNNVDFGALEGQLLSLKHDVTDVRDYLRDNILSYSESERGKPAAKPKGPLIGQCTEIWCRATAARVQSVSLGHKEPPGPLVRFLDAATAPILGGAMVSAGQLFDYAKEYRASALLDGRN